MKEDAGGLLTVSSDILISHDPLCFAYITEVIVHIWLHPVYFGKVFLFAISNTNRSNLRETIWNHTGKSKVYRRSQ